MGLDPAHITIVEEVPGSDIPLELKYLETWDGLYAPIGLRLPPGDGPHPLVLLASGNGGGGMDWIKDAVAGRGYIMDRLLEELDCFNQRLAAVEGHLEMLTAHDAVVAQLRTQVGIGPVTAWTLRAEVGRFDRFRSGKQLSRFCGLSPRNASSGERQADSGLIKAASAQLRAVLIEAAHCLCRHDPHWRQFAARLAAQHKPKSVIVAAVANRWIRRLYHEMQPAA
jgi:hypothetical protein